MTFFGRFFKGLSPRRPLDAQARRAKVSRIRQQAFGTIDDRTRAEDRQRLADAKAGRGSLI